MLIKIQTNKPIEGWALDRDDIFLDTPGTSGKFQCVGSCYTYSPTEGCYWEYHLEEIPVPKHLPTLTPQRLAWLENWVNNTDNDRDVADTVQALLQGYRDSLESLK